MKEKEVIGNGCGGNYADSQSANRKKQDAISRPHSVGFAGEREKLEARIQIICLLKHTAQSHQVQTVKTAKTVTSTHHSIWRQLYDIMHAAQKPKIKFEFVTLDIQSDMSTMWSQKKFLKICSREDLTGKAQERER